MLEIDGTFITQERCDLLPGDHNGVSHCWHGEGRNSGEEITKIDRQIRRSGIIEGAHDCQYARYQSNKTQVLGLFHTFIATSGGPLGLSLGIFFSNGLTLVVILSASSNGNFYFGFAVIEIQAKWYQG